MKETQVVTRAIELRSILSEIQSNGQTVGFVPTMGALHAGHASLLSKSISENSCTVLSVFVNPKQFGPREDFSRYPRTFSTDLKMAQELGVDILYAPTAEEMYPQNFQTNISVGEMGTVLCGAYRPGHFDGVCSVVTVLLNTINAHKAYFGLKDFQQYSIITRMCQDLVHRTQIIGVPTLREKDGLAMSSRNRFLDPKLREISATIPQALAAAAKLFIEGEKNCEKIISVCRKVFAEKQLETQYLEIRKCSNLAICEDLNSNDGVLAIALILVSETGIATRLIDNIILSGEPLYLQNLKSLLLQAEQVS